MAKKSLGVGFIGAGFIAQFHIRSWIGVRDANINGIMSKSVEESEVAAALVKRINVGDPKIFTSVTDMVADPGIDAIWICTPNFHRVDIMEEIVAAIESGKGELTGVACEKPLGRNIPEARKMLELAKKANLLDGYLEDQVFSPSVTRGKEIIWKRGAEFTGRPYLARASEEHGGPHMPWFWEGELQGGGVLNDMMCHSVEAARFLLTPPEADRGVLTPKKITAHTACLKWQRKKYSDVLKVISDGQLDYVNRPSEDFASSTVEYEDTEGNPIVVETSTSWSYVGAGLRLGIELLGPEYSMAINSLDTSLKVFFSREVAGEMGEDLIEKQNAEIGLMPVVDNQESVYGYEEENRHMVQSFLAGKRPMENFDDGIEVTKLLMAAYMSAELGKTILLPNPELETFMPAVARGKWNPLKKRDDV